MAFLFLALAVFLIWLIRLVWPVPSLSVVDSEGWKEVKEGAEAVKMLDVRDAAEFEKDPLPGTINISLGRLPYVWHQELSPNDAVMILAESPFERKKAARILHKRGFRNLYTHPGARLCQ